MLASTCLLWWLLLDMLELWITLDFIKGPGATTGTEAVPKLLESCPFFRKQVQLQQYVNHLNFLSLWKYTNAFSVP
jgi:hypothetical protein